jgi:hypothetical protein
LCSCAPPFTLFSFPPVLKENETRKAWIKAVQRKEALPNGKVKNWQPTKNSRICSIHFIDGKKTIPTKNLGEAGKYSTVHKPRKPPAKRTPVSHKGKDSFMEDESLVSQEPVSSEKASHSLCAIANEHSYYKKCLCECHIACSTSCPCKCHCSDTCSCCKSVEEVRVLDSHLEELSVQVHEAEIDTSTLKTRMEIMSWIQTDERVKIYVGLKTRAQFDDLHKHCIKKGAATMRYWCGGKRSKPTTRDFKSTPKKSGPRRKLSTEEELLMTLMKLRLSLINEVLGDMFGVSDTTVSQVFNTWIKFLSTELSPIIYWPAKDAVFPYYPKSLPEKYRHLRCTIDCTECFIEKPRNLELQSLTWSDYKKHNTVKFLVAISPNGSICFLSKAWCGRASDRRITMESGFMELIEPGDLVLADRGFPILEDLAVRNAILAIPPPSSGIEQQERSQVHKTSSVANARIHVERSIGRIKQYTILTNVLPISLVPLIDDIAVVCAALSNLQDPLVV